MSLCRFYRGSFGQRCCEDGVNVLRIPSRFFGLLFRSHRRWRVGSYVLHKPWSRRQKASPKLWYLFINERAFFYISLEFFFLHLTFYINLHMKTNTYWSLYLTVAIISTQYSFAYDQINQEFLLKKKCRLLRL